jgi:hypothetical protein
MALRKNLLENKEQEALSEEPLKELCEPIEPVALIGITEMTPAERQDLVLAKDGYLYFKSTLNEQKITISPLTRESFEGSIQYPTYAVQEIIEYAAQLKKSNEKLVAEIKRIKEAHAIDQNKVKLLEEQQVLDQAQIKTLKEISNSNQLKILEKKASEKAPLGQGAIKRKKRSVRFFQSEVKQSEKKEKLSPVKQTEIDNLLFDAIEAKDISKVASALEKGANIEARRDASPETPLGLAIKIQQEDMIEFLLKQNANPDNAFKYSWLSIRDLESPLSAIANHELSLSMLEILIKYKADVNKKDKEGDTPLHRAAVKERMDLVELLLKNGADPNLRNIAGRNPLEETCFWCKSLEMRKLLEDAMKSFQVQAPARVYQPFR